jgi:hypothetical protein
MAPKKLGYRTAVATSRVRRVAGLVGLGWSGAVLTVSCIVTPADLERGTVTLTPGCPYRALLGAPCPTCGLTRAFAAIGHGQIDLACRTHPLALVAYASLWLCALATGWLVLARSRA